MLERLQDVVSGVEYRTDGGARASKTDSSGDGGHHQSEANDAAADEPASDDGSTEQIEIGQVFEILRNQRRRYVLHYLTLVDTQVTLGTLAEQIAAWECDKEPAQITSQERKRVYVGLYQGHLPKMDAVGAISYEKDRGTIEPGENYERFRSHLPSEEGNTTQDDGQSLTQYISNLVH